MFFSFWIRSTKLNKTNCNIIVDLLNTRKLFLKEIQAHATEFLPKDVNVQKDIVHAKIPQKLFLPNFYSISKKQLQTISDLRKLLLWKENPSDAIKENDQGETDILDIFGPKINMINLVQANGKFTTVLFFVKI